MDAKPTHEQGQLHLQVYDQRREARLRDARDWFQANFRPKSFEDAMTLAPMGTEKGTYVGMVIGYWEQACLLLNYGLLHDGLFFETSGEFFGVWEAMKAVVPEFREKFHDPKMLSNLEQAAQRYEEWYEQRAPGHIAAMRQMMQAEATQKSEAANS